MNEIELREAFAVVPCHLRLASTERVYRRFLKAEGRFEETKPTEHVGQLRLRYRQYLDDARGLAPSTIGQHLVTIDAFLLSFLGSTGHLSTLASEHVEIFVQAISRQVRRQTLQHKVAHLRAFLRYCADRGETARGLDRIDTPRTYRGELPPRALGWDLIEKLLASVDRNDNLGRRDHAILHLMAYYGLRASEIASLTLDAVNWKAGTLHVDQRKTRSTLVLPLADQTHHPHIHCLVPGGVLAADGTGWTACRRRFFLLVHVLSRLFRRLFLERLQAAHAAGRLRFFGALEALRRTETFVEALRPLRKKRWIVYAKPPFGFPEHVLAYLGRYTHRVAIANSRLVSVCPQLSRMAMKPSSPPRCLGLAAMVLSVSATASNRIA